MIAIDVHYSSEGACAAAVGFRSWTDSSASLEIVERFSEAAAPYESGGFYKRELPYVLAVLVRARQQVSVETVVIDGYVSLGTSRPGLGAVLRATLPDLP